MRVPDGNLSKDDREGRKYDQEKLRFDLIPAEVETAFATVLTYGAKKYTTYGDCICVATALQQFTARESADPATSEISDIKTPSTPSDSESIEESGLSVTPNEYVPPISDELPKTGRTHSTVGATPHENTGSLSKSMKELLPDLVASAVQLSGLDISIIRTRQARLEGLSVTAVILASDSWRRGGKRGAEQHLNGCLALEVIKTGDGNWEKGIEWMRCYAAARRHLNAWLRREDIDEESGLPAIDLALCELAFLSTFYHRKNGVDWDDRP